MPIKPIQKKNISDQICQQIQQHIMKGDWKPGSRIPSENELTEMFEVSRISVREALQKLTALGILESRQGDGTFVKEMSVSLYMNSLIPMLVLDAAQVLEIVEFRRAIEVESARLAAVKRNEENIRQLRVIYEKMKLYKDDLVSFATCDLDFHIELAAATGNSIIIKVNNIIKDILVPQIQYIVGIMGTTPGLYYHERIIDAVERQDAEGAMEIMREHIDNTILYLHKNEESRP